MEDSRKPLTAWEIEELRKLEAKATPEPWRVEQRGANGDVRLCGKDEYGDECVLADYMGWDTDDFALVAAMRNALPRILSMLTPPTEAEVRKAFGNVCYRMNMRDHVEYEDVETLLRAVQAPRLTGEQVKEAYLNGYEDGNDDGRALTGCRNVYEHTPRHDPDTAWAKSDTRAAFPELAGEVGRG